MRVNFDGLEATHRKLNKLDAAIKKNRGIAIRVELYRLRKLLIADIRKGAGYPALSFAARASSKGLKRRKPFTQLFSTQGAPSPGKGVVPVRYHEAVGGKRYELGFTDTKKERLSKNWKFILNAQQTGFSRVISEKQRKAWIKRGAHWKKKSPRAKLGKVFFLRKSTTTMKTPARPMVAPFWSAHKNEAMRNFASNFDKKMKGEKI